jgi:hypothetical protein
MPSTRQELENQISSTTDRVQELASKAAARTTDAMDAKRRDVADALDGTAKAIDGQADRLPEPFDELADSVQDGLGTAARYVRRNDAGDMAGDLIDCIKQSPVASGLAIGAALVGGGLLVNGLLRARGGESGHPFAALAEALGPKAGDTFNLFRDALIALAVARAVEAFDEALPGFKDHFERASQ